MSLPGPSEKSYFDHDGLEIVFVKQLPPELQVECSICLQLLAEPVILNCNCGVNFCKKCIEPIKVKRNPCPLCNVKFGVTVRNKQLERTLNGLQRRLVKKDCLVLPIECEFAYAGCTEKVPQANMAAHLVDKIAQHMTLLARQHRKDRTEIEALRGTVNSKHLPVQQPPTFGTIPIKKSKPLPIQPPAYHTVPIELTVSDVEERPGMWTSTPFYLKTGYKMVLEVYPECEYDACSHYFEDYHNFLAVYLYIIRGEFDEQLKWPFVGEVDVKMINQRQGEHQTATAKYYPGDSRGARRWRDSLSGRNGWPEFIGLRFLYPNYLVNIVFCVE